MHLGLIWDIFRKFQIFYRPLGCFGHFGTIWDELRIFYFKVKKKTRPGGLDYSYIIDTNTGYLFIWRGFYEIIWKKKAIFNSYEGEILHFHLLKLKR